MTHSDSAPADTSSQRLNTLLSALCAEPEFLRLDSELKIFNPFRVLKVERYELRHTTTLAWLLNPHGSHGMGNVFLKNLLGLFGKEDAFWSTAETESADVLGELVFDEKKGFVRSAADDPADAPRSVGARLDVLVEGRNGHDGAKWCVAIEAKIDSKEGAKQRERYDTWLEPSFGEHQLLKLYLTVGPVAYAHPAREAALRASGWKNVFWGEQIAEALDATLQAIKNRKLALQPQVHEFLTHYQQLLSSLSKKNTSDLDHQVYAFANGSQANRILRTVKRQIDAKPALARHWDIERRIPAYWKHRSLLDRCIAMLRSAESAFIWDHALKGLSKQDWHILSSTTADAGVVALVPCSWLTVPSLRDKDNNWNLYYRIEFRRTLGDVELKLYVPETGNHATQAAILDKLLSRSTPNAALALDPEHMSSQARATFARFRVNPVDASGKVTPKSMKLYTASLQWRAVADGYEPNPGHKPEADAAFARFWEVAKVQIKVIAAVAQLLPTPISSTMIERQQYQ